VKPPTRDATREPDARVTVRFALDGVGYEADLTDEQDQRLRGLLARYIAAAHPANGRVRRRSARR
jgi:hypothetical protein